QELQPCSPLNQLRQHVEQHILGGPFATVKVPLRVHDPIYLRSEGKPAHTDLLVNYNVTDRLLAIADAKRTGALELDMFQGNEVERRQATAQRQFDVPQPDVVAGVPRGGRPTTGPLRAVGAGMRGGAGPRTGTRGELRGFLDCPAEAVVKRHLGRRDEDEPEPVDDEPFYTETPFDKQLVREFLQRFTARAVATGV